MIKNSLICFLVFVVIILSISLSHTENQIYALLTKMCEPWKPEAVPCLTYVETRTSWVWHIFYAVLNSYAELSEKYSSDDGQWSGFVYPNKHDLSVSVEIGTFNSIEECRTAARYKLVFTNTVASGDYECGLNCTSSPLGGNVCKKTKR